MGREDFEIVVIRKSGPTQSMKIKGWWITMLLVLALLTGATLGIGAFILYRQYWVVTEIAEDTRLLMFRTERLEALVQEQETRELLVSQQNQPARHTPPPLPQTQTAPSQPTPMSEGGETVPAAAEPNKSSLLSITNVSQIVESGNMSISFDIVNEQGAEPAVGYIAVIAHGTRQGKPWIEAWPPMRLNEQGRPEQYRRGTPFSVQRFRTVRARMAMADKTFERLEFVFYSRQGDVVLVSSFPVNLPAPQEPANGQ